MNRQQWLVVFCILACLALAPAAQAQQRPYIGYAYPAGGQQGTTFQVRLGGQGIDEIEGVTVSGPGVSAKLVECLRRLNNQEVQLLREQLRDLKSTKTNAESATASMMSDGTQMMASSGSDAKGGVLSGRVLSPREPVAAGKGDTASLAERIKKRADDFVQTPACASIASLAVAEITIAADAEPGDREIRLVTRRGVSNPLVFQVGQVPEVSRKPMLTASIQVLGKEASALRKRPPEEVEDRISLPCTVNGQIASGEVNKYRFEAKKGQRLVFVTSARHLVPFIADAVPGWFQPVLALYDAKGKEVAFADDYRFNPDPVILYEVPNDGEYVFVIYDSIYRGREDFVYRVTAGELPFATGVFPLGGRKGEPARVKITGWNLDKAQVTAPAPDAAPGVHLVVSPGRVLSPREPVAPGKGDTANHVATTGRKLVSNRLPFEVGTLPEVFEKENNNTPARAQKVQLPLVINGRIDTKDDWDVFQIRGKAGQSIKAEVSARRLDSPLDSVIKLTDAKGNLLAFNDDVEDLGAGINTHPADSAFIATLPADGVYFVHIGDTARQGGAQYAYRLCLGEPKPDFALRVTPSSTTLRSKGNAQLTVQLMRKDGFAGPVKVILKDPPEGFSANPLSLSGTQTVARVSIKTTLAATKQPVDLVIAGTAKIKGEEVTHDAVPAEDRTQAFYWHHLVPASDLKVTVFDPSYEPPLARPLPEIPTNTVAVASAGQEPKKQTFSKQQIAGRLRQLKALFEEGLLTDEFYATRVAECNAAQ